MATKRPRSPLDELPDEPISQRRKTTPSLADVIKTVMMMQSMQSFVVLLEPMLRRVVRDEVERALAHLHKALPRTASGKQLEAPQPTSSLRLVFEQEPAPQIFTGSKIVDSGGRALRLRLVDASGGTAYAIPPTIKIEIVVVDGDFASDGRDKWAREEFDLSVLKERTGRRALLQGEVAVTMRGGAASLGDITITDNSSWVRSRHFRVGARVTSGGSGGGPRIQEAISQRFVVKDHRGESYKKSYPPAPTDEVWRLKNIAKDGRYHDRLAAESIHTVEDFLKLWVVDPQKLRQILGGGMADKAWELTIEHARTCTRGSRFFVHRGAPGFAVAVNSVCEVLAVVVNAEVYTNPGIPFPQKSIAEAMAREAYARWGSLEAFEGMVPVVDALLQPLLEDQERSFTPSSHHQEGVMMATSYQSAEFEFNVVGSLPESFDGSCFSGWLCQGASAPQGFAYGKAEFASSDDESSSLSQAYFLN